MDEEIFARIETAWRDGRLTEDMIESLSLAAEDPSALGRRLVEAGIEPNWEEPEERPDWISEIVGTR